MTNYSEEDKKEFYNDAKEILNSEIKSQAQYDFIRQTEYKITEARAKAISKDPIKGNYDAEHLGKIHHKLFDNLYDHAGKQRNVFLAKRAMSPDNKLETGYFTEPNKIDESFNKFTDDLKKDNYLKNLDKNNFVDKFTDYYATINEIHPFEEGNGRATKLLMGQLAKEAGYDVNFQEAKREDWNYASKRSLTNQTYNYGSDQITQKKDIQLLKDVMESITSEIPKEKIQAKENREYYGKVNEINKETTTQITPTGKIIEHKNDDLKNHNLKENQSYKISYDSNKNVSINTDNQKSKEVEVIKEKNNSLDFDK